MFYCPHDPHFALLMAASGEADAPPPSAVISLFAGVVACVAGVLLLGF